MKNNMAIEKELEWLQEFINNRIQSYFEDKPFDIISPPNIYDSSYYLFLKKYNLGLEYRIIISLTLAYELKPNILDIFTTKNTLYDRPFSEFGGKIDEKNSSFIPTLQTALFLLSGKNINSFLDYLFLFHSQNHLIKNKILDINLLNIYSELKLRKSIFFEIVYGKLLEEELEINSLAQKFTTNYEWNDLVLPDYTMEHLEEIELWLDLGEEFLEKWNNKKFIKKGYKALFYGPSGTGKTLTASLLGKKYNRDVYRIDLSQIVSKYIGETEKNLEKVFYLAHKKEWILFFDEADSLFGRRTDVSSSNDKYANQETAYLLQRVEEYEGIVILATNLKDNLDDAFLRRFQSIIYFPKPEENERLKLWQNSFAKIADISKIDLKQIAKKYELTGANIINIVRYSSLKAIKRGSYTIEYNDILTSIRREKYKEGKIL